MTTAKVAARSEEPGYKTSEFWLTLVAMVAATVLRVLNDIDADAWMIVVGGSGVGYNINRAIVKK